MNIFTAIGTGMKALFGSSDNGKSLVAEANDVVERWNPSEVKQHEMSIEDITAGDASQESAREMQFKSHDSWFDILIDGINRAIRPLFSVWAFAMLFGWIEPPAHWNTMHPMAWNIIWTIIGFWFGARIVFKDIPSILKRLKK